MECFGIKQAKYYANLLLLSNIHVSPLFDVSVSKLKRFYVKYELWLVLFSGIYKVVLEHKKLGMSKDVLANKILPFVMPICIDNNLNLSQVIHIKDFTISNCNIYF